MLQNMNILDATTDWHHLTGYLGIGVYTCPKVTALEAEIVFACLRGFQVKFLKSVSQDLQSAHLQAGTGSSVLFSSEKQQTMIQNT